MTFFILGSHPDIARAEILSVLGASTKIIAESSTVLVVESVEMPLEVLQERLGGTIKIGTVLEEFPTLDARACVEMIAAKAGKAEGKNKITFGLSAYDLGNPNSVRKISNNFRTLGGEVKSRLKELDRPVRFVQAKEAALSSVVVLTNDLLKSGGEFVLLVTKTSIIIGKTATVQNFELWSRRDFGRPMRDTRSGMLPPKLARMMINLAGVDPKDAMLLDPFCGSGTILMEAAMIGYKKVIGSDNSEKAIADSKTNTDWFYAQTYIEKGTPYNSIEIIESPAETIDHVLKNPVDVIVGETYLGPPRRSNERTEMEKMIKGLMSLYRDSLIALAKQTKPNGVIVIAFPAFVIKNDVIHLPLKKMIQEIGLTFDHAWIYKREDQQTAREIVRMTKN